MSKTKTKPDPYQLVGADRKQQLSADRKEHKKRWRLIRDDICEQIRVIRQAKGVRSKQMALRVGITCHNYSQLEHCHRDGVSFDLLDFVLRKLGYQLVLKIERLP